MRCKYQGHWERKCENRFLFISSSKVDRKPKRSAANSTRIVEDISPAEMLRFCDFCLNYPGAPHATVDSGHLAVHLHVLVLQPLKKTTRLKGTQFM